MKPLGETYRDVERRWKALRTTHWHHVREIACVGAARTLLCVEFGDSALPAVTIAAGVHGDEPAGPWALLRLVEAGALDERFSYRVWPCTNPTGFDAGTRENAEGTDVNRTFGGGGRSPEAKAMLTANRDRTFALSLDLHEDADARGFYCYEYGGGQIGAAVLEALDRAGIAIEPLDEGFDAGPLDAATSRREPGRIVADHRRESARLGALSYSLAIARRAATHALTFETPSARAWDERLEAHALAVRAAIAALELRITQRRRVR